MFKQLHHSYCQFMFYYSNMGLQWASNNDYSLLSRIIFEWYKILHCHVCAQAVLCFHVWFASVIAAMFVHRQLIKFICDAHLFKHCLHEVRTATVKNFDFDRTVNVINNCLLIITFTHSLEWNVIFSANFARMCSSELMWQLISLFR